jgi:hypothetical protein
MRHVPAVGEEPWEASYLCLNWSRDDLLRNLEVCSDKEIVQLMSHVFIS